MASKSESKAKQRGKGKPIQKGQVLNPTGRPKLPQEIRAMKEASTEQLIYSYHKFAFTHQSELKNNSAENMIEQGVLQVIANFANSGEVDQISKLWDRVLGKPMESVDITTKGQSITQNEKLTPEERRALIEKLRSEIANNNG
jgi:hypothetical protein